MAKEIIYRCDKAGCNLTRPALSETNHWFTVLVEISEPNDPHIHIWPFRPNIYPKDKIFCGEAHALEYIATELPKLFPKTELDKVVDFCKTTTLSIKEVASAIPRIKRSEDRESDMDQLNPIDEHYENIAREENYLHGSIGQPYER